MLRSRSTLLVFLFVLPLLCHAQKEEVILAKYGVTKVTRDGRDITKKAILNSTMLSFYKKEGDLYLRVAELAKDTAINGMVRRFRVTHKFGKPEYKNDGYGFTFDWYGGKITDLWRPYKPAACLLLINNDEKPLMLMRIAWEEGKVTEYECRRIGPMAPELLDYIEEYLPTWDGENRFGSE
ncbi:hypothetical protein [Robertkochia sediminum]|uniref:hypothetical protein n=1 Tax=Robertkochia sediminum TaxID=2785326 RepID=UPI0019328FA2|nr:hypothetical protein [Robertkochia sediminum]MBL7471391.1 hypothetical protein [Robertkochia sediminum]